MADPRFAPLAGRYVASCHPGRTVPLANLSRARTASARVRLPSERSRHADSTSLVLYDPRTADPEAIALAGFLAGYGGRTREAYALDLRLFFS